MTSISAFHDILGPTRPQWQFFTAVDLRLSDESANTRSEPRRNDAAWLNLNHITEIIGSESGDHFTAEELQPPLHYRYSNAAGQSRSASAISDGRDFPPEWISTLDRAGRPRFLLKKARISTSESFRLLIHMEETDYPPPLSFLVGGYVSKKDDEDGAAGAS